MSTIHPKLVSVIVPFFGVPAEVAGLLQALAKQTLSSEKWELVLVDNGAGPGADGGALRDLVRATIPNSRYEHEPNPGPYAARNRGVDCASGRYLVFTDGDCQPNPNWLEAGITAMGRLGAECVMGGAIHLFSRDENRVSLVELYDRYFTPLAQESFVRRENYAATANLWVARDLFQRVGRFRAELLDGGDTEWCWRATSLGAALAYEPSAIVRHPLRDNWRSVITRTRRGCGGRHHLSALVPGGRPPFHNRVRLFGEVLASMRRERLPPWRQSVLIAAAVLLRFVEGYEQVRLALHFPAERR